MYKVQECQMCPLSCSVVFFLTVSSISASICPLICFKLQKPTIWKWTLSLSSITSPLSPSHSSLTSATFSMCVYLFTTLPLIVFIVWNRKSFIIITAFESQFTCGEQIFILMASSPAGLPLCHSETPAWMTPPPWMSCSRHTQRPPASAGEVTDRPAAARRRSTGTCRSPTWMDPPRLLVCRIAAGVSESERSV